MAREVVYTYTCDKCGRVEKNDGGLPTQWRYVGLNLYFTDEDGHTPSITHKFLACYECVGTAGYVNEIEKKNRGLFAWLMGEK